MSVIKFKSDEWLINSIRITIFRSQVESINHELFESVIGMDSDKTENDKKNLIMTDELVRDDYIIKLKQSADRIHWFMDPIELKKSDIDNLGMFKNAFERMYNELSLWLESLDDINRVGLGMIALFEVRDLENGFEKLDELLESVNVDPSNTSDFMYQVNRKEKINHDINRLGKWRLFTIRNIKISDLEDSKLNNGSQKQYIFADLDINTPPQDKVFPSSEIKDLFEELKTAAEYTLENADKIGLGAYGVKRHVNK